jgi:hypothetical protein
MSTFANLIKIPILSLAVSPFRHPYELNYIQYRNQLSLQQDARLHLQREALQQRQAELRSVDQRILELQGRLQRKKAANSLMEQQLQQNTTNVPNFKSQQPTNIHVR